MIKTIQQTWHVSYYDEPYPGITITRKEDNVIVNRHDFTLEAARELSKELDECIIEAEGA